MKPEVCLAAKRRTLRCNEVLSGRAEGGWSPRRGLFCQDRAKMVVMNPGLRVSTARRSPPPGREMGETQFSALKQTTLWFKRQHSGIKRLKQLRALMSSPFFW